jgi:hypothetical protein
MFPRMDASVTPEASKPGWHPPTLTNLGNAATLTAAQFLAVNDGGGGSS